MKIRLAAVCTLLALFCRSSSASEPLNVVFIFADDLGWADTTLYGQTTFYQTPNVERLAKRGMTFTHAYSASPLCSPTRSAVLTGLSPARTGITTPNCHLPQVVLQATVGKSAAANQHAVQPTTVTRLQIAYPTLSKTLKAAGYATGHFGKWHLGAEPYSPLEHGFDVDIPHHPGPGPAGSFVAPWKFKNFTERTPGEHLEDRMADEAVAWMEQNQDRPFFLNYWQFSVHAPFDAKAELIEKHRARVNSQDAQRSPTYAAMVESFDDAIGTLLDALDRLHLTDKTIVIFSSDNGGNMYNEVDGTTPTSNRPLRGGKATMFEGGTRVPQVIVWPGVTAPGSRSDVLTQSEDFYPTLLDGLRLEPQPDQIFDGVSIMPVLEGQRQQRETVFQYFPHAPGVPDWLPPSVSVHRHDGWKLIRLFHAGQDEVHRYLLYDLNNDLGEQTNLADQQANLVAELDDLIEGFLQETKAVRPLPNPAFNPAVYRPELEGVQTNQKRARGRSAEQQPRSQKTGGNKPASAASRAGTCVFAGGVAGVQALADASHSTAFRAAGGGLYLHNNGWAALTPAQQRQVLDAFAGRPIGIELGFNPSAEAWAKRYQSGYAAMGIIPEFITANAFDKNNHPTPEQWTHYTQVLRKQGGVPESTLILPTFEYANFAPNIPKIVDTNVSRTPEFQALIRAAGGITLDSPPGYFFGREQNYRDWIVDAIVWTQKAGLRVVLIVSPHRSGERFAEDTAKMIAYLSDCNALPDTFVSENYEAKPASDYPNLVGPETLPYTALGVGLQLTTIAKPISRWRPSGHAQLRSGNGMLVITSTGNDPFIATDGLPSNANGPFRVRLRFSSTGDGSGVVYYTTQPGQAFHRDRTVTFPIDHDGKFHDHEISLPVSTLSALRLDPGNASGTITIAQFELVDANGVEISLPKLAP